MLSYTHPMPPEVPGPATPRDPAARSLTEGQPTFRGGVEPVGERTGGVQPGRAPDLPFAVDDDPPRQRGGQPRRMRVRRVQRVVRHVDPWSVLKLAIMFFGALFLIVGVAAVLLWGAARSSGTIENVESFITSVGGFGNCEPIDGAEGSTTTTTAPQNTSTTLPVDQIDPAAPEETLPPEELDPQPDEDEDCPAGEELVGDFKFEDGRIFQAFALAGVVLVLAGSAGAVVLVLLFNLMSDLTGGLRMTVVQEGPAPVKGKGGRSRSGSPPQRRRE